MPSKRRINSLEKFKVHTCFTIFDIVSNKLSERFIPDESNEDLYTDCAFLDPKNFKDLKDVPHRALIISMI
jgi:hypothetical protein